MKKLLSIILVLVIALSLCACGAGSEAQDANEVTEQPEQEQEQEPTEPQENENDTSSVALSDLKQGDEVSIIGQVASGTLVNGNTLWVQVLQDDGSTVIYHCQLKDDFIEKGEALQLLDTAKVKGNFLSLMDLQEENTALLVTLNDCEIIG